MRVPVETPNMQCIMGFAQREKGSSVVLLKPNLCNYRVDIHSTFMPLQTGSNKWPNTPPKLRLETSVLLMVIYLSSLASTVVSMAIASAKHDVCSLHITK